MKQLLSVCWWSLVFGLLLSLAPQMKKGNSSSVFAQHSAQHSAQYSAQQPLETLAPKAVQNLASTKLFFGVPIVFSAEIAAESTIPAKELLVSIKFLGDTKIEMPYLPKQEMMRVPGYARKVEVEILRMQDDGKKEKTLLWKQTIEPEQTPPDFVLSQIKTELTSRTKSSPTSECAFTVRNIKVDFAKPIDTQAEKVITALVDDLQVAEPSIDAAKTELTFETAGKTDIARTQAIKPANITCSGFFNDGLFLVNVVLGKLPKTMLKGKTLRGTLGIRLSVTLLNRRATRSATKDETILVPILLQF